MRIVIIGAGRSGVSLAANLAGAGHRITVIDRDAGSTERAFERYGLATLTGEATDPGLLKEAEVGRADVVVTLLRRDADNLAVAHLSRQLGAHRVMARLNDQGYRQSYVEAGVQQIFSEIDLLVHTLATSIEHPLMSHSMSLGGGESIAFELIVPQGAAAAGQTVREIDGHPRFPRGCLFVGVADETGQVQVPRGDTVIYGGSTVILVAGRAAIHDAIAFLTDLAVQGRTDTKTAPAAGSPGATLSPGEYVATDPPPRP